MQLQVSDTVLSTLIAHLIIKITQVVISFYFMFYKNKNWDAQKLSPRSYSWFIAKLGGNLFLSNSNASVDSFNKYLLRIFLCSSQDGEVDKHGTSFLSQPR